MSALPVQRNIAGMSSGPVRRPLGLTPRIAVGQIWRRDGYEREIVEITDVRVVWKRPRSKGRDFRSPHAQWSDWMQEALFGPYEKQGKPQHRRPKPVPPKAKPIPFPTPLPPSKPSSLDAHIEKLRAQHEAAVRLREVNSVKPIRMEDIIEAVCAYCDIDPVDVASRSRHFRLVLCRELIVLAARKFTTRSYPEIARAMGRPNHSTVITAHQRARPKIGDEADEYVLAADQYGPLQGRTYRDVWQQVSKAVLATRRKF